ncbi:hypothetical protein D9M71_677260 [compost metagenome]
MANKWLVSFASARMSARLDIRAMRVSSEPGRRISVAFLMAADTALSAAVPEITAMVTPGLS